MQKKLANAFAPASKVTQAIRVNQIGYLPNDCKCAVLVGGGDVFELIDTESGKTVYSANAKAVSDTPDPDSQDIICYADFSEFTSCGKYKLVSNGVESHPFEIKHGVYRELHNAMIKMLYYQRCGCALEEKYAGKFTHAPCHCTKGTYYDRLTVETDESGRKYKNLENAKTVEAYGGWHEAGDFSKCLTSGSIAAMLLMLGVEYFPDSYKDSLNIPESGNGVPDALNECRYELEYAMRTQREDCGFANVVFPWEHPATVMPDADKDPYFMWQSSAESTGDAVMILAHAARIYKQYDSEFAAKCLESAKRGWEWLEAHPENLPFHSISPYPNGYGLIFGSDIETPADKRFAAACALYAATYDERYHTAIKQYAYGFSRYADMRKGDFTGFGVIEYVLNTPEEYTSAPIRRFLKERFIEEAKKMYGFYLAQGYNLSNLTGRYGWASNSGIMENACKMIFAQLMDSELDFNDAISCTYSYLLGTNAVDKCFVTCYGANPFLKPHHRQMESDGIEENIPGFVAGGCVSYERVIGSARGVDDYIASNSPPLKCFIDEHPYYMMTEVEVDWNTYPSFVSAYLLNRDKK